MADLGVDVSLKIALSELEKKVGQAEVDRDNLKTNLSNKGVNVSGLNKMKDIIEKTKQLYFLENPIKGTTISYLINQEEIHFDSKDDIVNHYIYGGKIYFVMNTPVPKKTWWNGILKSFDLASKTFDKVINIFSGNSDMNLITSAIFEGNVAYVTSESGEIRKYTLPNLEEIDSVSMGLSSTNPWTKSEMFIVGNSMYVGHGDTKWGYAKIVKINKTTMDIENEYVFPDVSPITSDKICEFQTMAFDLKNNVIYAMASYGGYNGAYSNTRIAKLSLNDLSLITYTTSDESETYSKAIVKDDKLIYIKDDTTLTVKDLSIDGYPKLSSVNLSKMLCDSFKGVCFISEDRRYLSVFDNYSTMIYVDTSDSNKYTLFSSPGLCKRITIDKNGVIYSNSTKFSNKYKSLTI